jgi:hypothetical protein
VLAGLPPVQPGLHEQHREGQPGAESPVRPLPI